MSSIYRPEHVAIGDPCERCNRPASSHRGARQRTRVDQRPEHTPEGNPCKKCGLPPKSHRSRHNRPRRAEHVAMGDPCERCGLSADRHFPRQRTRKPAEKRIILGIDGEGKGRNPHRYTLLAFSDATGERSAYVENLEGLTSAQCLKFLTEELPSHREALVFAFSFGYDLTKILADLPNKLLYVLFHEDYRYDEEEHLHPIRWRQYSINLLRSRFTITNLRTKKKVIIWDCFKFFQSKFTKALEDWNITTDAREMGEMKNKRSEFDKLSDSRIRAYCLEECRCLALLMNAVIDAHNSIGLKLKGYHGAGSTANALLKSKGIKKDDKEYDPDMRQAISAAFFGGRFEVSRMGPVSRPCWGYDISSAYPYQTVFLPCLEHGKWSHTKKESTALNATIACVRYSLDAAKPRSVEHWAPFPFRLLDGTITFPIVSSGGWIWLNEYREGKRQWPHVRFKEAWLYKKRCDCKPFQWVPQYYRERVKLGKEGRGIVIKLGLNALYGKLAQSVGNPPFQSWIWAGLITSGCRAQILELMQLAGHRNVLQVATDGVYTTQRVKAPMPFDTNTSDLPKPLGGWEEKPAPKGIYLVRPGIYFPLNPTDKELLEVRARGVGRYVMQRSWKLAVEAFESGAESVIMAEVIRFMGAVSALTLAGKGTRVNRSPEYGEWVPRPIEVSFDAQPKRERMLANGQLELRQFPGIESAPYDPSIMSQEALEMKWSQLELEEQPNGDLSEP